MRYVIAGLLLIAAASTGGCATLRASSNSDAGTPRFFAGTRLDLATIHGDPEALWPFVKSGIAPPAYPLWDLPLSLVADTAIIPLTGLKESEARDSRGYGAH
jgi:uncharacterized protein YceK